MARGRPAVQKDLDSRLPDLVQDRLVHRDRDAVAHGQRRRIAGPSREPRALIEHQFRVVDRVHTGPGTTRFTRIPRSISACASENVNTWTAPLVAEYSVDGLLGGGHVVDQDAELPQLLDGAPHDVCAVGGFGQVTTQ